MPRRHPLPVILPFARPEPASDGPAYRVVVDLPALAEPSVLELLVRPSGTTITRLSASDASPASAG